MTPISLRARLFILLSAATGLVWLFAVLWIQHSTRAEVEQVLDARLAEAATMVSSLISEQRIELSADAAPLVIQKATGHHYSRKLSCQIWSLTGNLVGRSEGAPVGQLTDATGTGYSETLVDGEVWRVYSVDNPDLGVRVMIGDALEVRERLVRDVIEGLLLPAAVILPILAMLIWLSVAQGLVPLKRLEAALRARAPADLSPLPDGPTPREIRPVRRALNRLFAEVETVRATERDFIAFAAHELKTPLAGLRTQAQIARIATDPETQKHALAVIERSVVRTDHLVRQLLELASVERDTAKTAAVELDRLLSDVSADLDALASERNVHVEISGDKGCMLESNRFLLHAAIRNLVENAIQASAPDGKVRIELRQDEVETIITVDDDGPAIPADLIERVTERFFRGPDASSDGSGLGLSIVASALDRLGGTLRFSPAPKQGQRVRIIFPK